MPAIIMVTVWRFAPYFMVIFLAALLALPEDYYEAAELDGAERDRRFWFIHITLPLLMPTIFFVVVVSALLCARIFLMPYLITGGGPGNATRVLSMLIYETGFSYLKMGQAAAISVVLFTIMMVFTALQIRLFARQRTGLPRDDDARAFPSTVESFASSWPGLSRPSTSWRPERKTWMRSNSAMPSCVLF